MENYQKHFTSSRNPQAITIYTAKMKSLQDLDSMHSDIMHSLGTYVKTVTQGTFLEERYSTENNLHLSTVFQSKQDLIDQWKTGLKIPLNTLMDESESQEIKEISIPEWLETKLITDRHLNNLSSFTYLDQFLQTNAEQEKIEIEKALKTEERSSTNLKKPSLAFQASILDLYRETNKNKQLGLLKKIGRFLSSLDSSAEFLNDIQGLKQTLIDSLNQDTGILDVFDTDDPIDLLLCGTEVPGSCQRVDGSANLNKGLLGYLMDGKNRLIAVKNSKGKIYGRALLRLLWRYCQMLCLSV